MNDKYCNVEEQQIGTEDKPGLSWNECHHALGTSHGLPYESIQDM